jgi:dihydroorotate dehydrogenase (fumarate)
MADLRTNYLGLELKNPVIASSSSITSTVKGVKQCAEAGAGAVVLQSLFEEQILAELGGASGSAGSAFSDEAAAYLHDLEHSYGPQGYLRLIADAKDSVDVPVIASLNCISGDHWTDYAAQIEAAGADALELNIALMPISLTERGEEIEERMRLIVREIRSATRLPITAKIGPYFTALPRLLAGLVEAGLDGIVLFNRFYQLDIDPVALAPIPGNRFSTSDELPLPLRWISILSPKIPCDFSLTTGVHTGVDAAKAIVAGAKIVQIASALYRRKIPGIGAIVSELDLWLDSDGYASASAARGRFANSPGYRPEELERLQYIRALSRKSV